MRHNLIVLLSVLLILPISSSATAIDDRLFDWSSTISNTWSADFMIFPARVETRVGVDIAGLMAAGTHRTVYSSEKKRWSAMVQLLATFPNRPSPRAGMETRFGIVFLSRSQPIGSLFCRNPYAIAPSETVVDCFVQGKVKTIPVSTLRALVGITFAPEER